MKKLVFSTILFCMLHNLSYSQSVVKFDSWIPNKWNNTDLVLTEIVKNPVKDIGVTNVNVLKVTKNGGDNAKASHSILTNSPITLTNKNHIFELKVLFLANENSVDNTKLALRMGDNWQYEVAKEIKTSNNWQTLQFDFSQNPKLATIFEQNRDTTVNHVLFFSRKYADQKPNIILYINDLKTVSK